MDSVVFYRKLIGKEVVIEGTFPIPTEAGPQYLGTKVRCFDVITEGAVGSERVVALLIGDQEDTASAIMLCNLRSVTPFSPGHITRPSSLIRPV